MKRILWTLAACLFFCGPVFARQPVYLFPEFVVGHLVFHDQSQADVKLNFDALGQKIVYYDGDNLMEMTNLPMLKVLEAADRVFVVKDGLLCEVFDRPGGPVLVNWRFREVNRGSKGALGLPTQGKVEAMRISPYDFTAVDASSPEAVQGTYLADVWKKENANIYFISVGGKSFRIRSQRDLYKKFPSQTAQLKEFIGEHHLSFYKLDDALQILDQLMSDSAQ